MTNLRLIPVLVLAASALLALKLLGLAVDGGTSVTAGVSVAMAQQAADPAAAPADAASTAQDQAPATEPAASGDTAAADPAAVPPLPAGLGGGDAPAAPGGLELGGSIAERKVLESLSDRRRELDNREKQFELRQQLMKDTEQRLQQKVDEIAAIEERIRTLNQEQEKKREDELKDLVLMYESMKAKDAARIFDRLDLDILVRVAKQMKPRKMADIMGRMTPEASERLTVALVTGRKPDVEAAPVVAPDLPKIMGN
ncbi:MotE family protein [Stappia indica]|uniref:Flagellar motility protein MotE, a chaperone for MotC folding n=1 Tax=Stappia indica TaxID=538381 RepID=A0A285R4Y6_9HYPH|nr:hypothetical protein [Stappia indica]SOB89161.1 Flagellar motility protein MotE, a chaperone for MotC folding [Stappia indica]